MMTEPSNPERREALKKIVTGGAALVAGAAFVSHEDRVHAGQLARWTERSPDVPPDVWWQAHTNWGKLSDLKKKVTTETIKGLEISRMIMGSNLVNGWSHSRDLLYVAESMRAYHTREKTFAMLKLGEACGINAYSAGGENMNLMTDYWENAGGTMRFIVQASTLDEALHCLDRGASTAYLHGGVCDHLVHERNFDVITAFVEGMRRRGAVVGIGAHRLEAIKGCVENGIEPDYWASAIHHGNYWSRMPDKPEYNNVWCRHPEETIEFMDALPQPWIGFKVLAAGAIQPHDGFRWAFEAGVDFQSVGMYDFHVVDNVNTFMDILDSDINRKRPWRFT